MELLAGYILDIIILRMKVGVVETFSHFLGRNYEFRTIGMLDNSSFPYRDICSLWLASVTTTFWKLITFI